ncbi:protein NOI4-like isoform X1 [Salvia splendens]|uniref:protein NOI4-like isoform X1 n=1 Tax=Salvia splendens TaxID=180675 RepID=UPI001C27148B|nr:protein NOI4-like isoform X1 [Salvia splendens]
MSEKGRPLPKFGEWDVNDPTSAEGFTVIFNKARDEKKTGGKPDSPSKVDTNTNYGGAEPIKPQGSGLLSTQLIQALAVSLNFPYNHKKWFCCMQSPSATS